MLKRKYTLALAICLLAVSADQVSKTVVKEELYPNKNVVLVDGFFEFKYAENPGMMLGMLKGLDNSLRIPLFTGITLVAVFIIVHLLRQAPDQAVRLPVALGFILSGAFGNLTDRFRWGHVVDFIRVWLWPPKNFVWPTFNLADTFITIGISLLLLDMLLSSGEEESAVETAAEGDVDDVCPPIPREDEPEEAGSGTV